MPEETKTPPVKKTEAEWRELLSPEQFHIMREKGTEPPFTGKLISAQWDDWRDAGFRERLSSEPDLATIRRIVWSLRLSRWISMRPRTAS